MDTNHLLQTKQAVSGGCQTDHTGTSFYHLRHFLPVLKSSCAFGKRWLCCCSLPRLPTQPLHFSSGYWHTQWNAQTLDLKLQKGRFNSWWEGPGFLSGSLLESESSLLCFQLPPNPWDRYIATLPSPAQACAPGINISVDSGTLNSPESEKTSLWNKGLPLIRISHSEGNYTLIW